MLRLLASPTLSLGRITAYVSLAALTGTALAFGCGGGGANTGSGGHTTGSQSDATNGSGGMGGDLFHPSVNSGNTTGTGGDTNGSTGSGPVPGMACKGTASPGANQWAGAYGDAMGQYGLAVTTDPSGNILVTGSYSGTLTMGGKTADVTGADKAAFVAKLSPTGTPLWVRGFKSVKVAGNALPLATGRSIATDSAGNVFVGGDFTGQITFGGTTTPLTSAGGFFGDMFLLKLDATGSTQLASRIGDPSSTPSSGGSTQTSRSLTVFKSAAGDQVALAGDAEGTLDIGGGKTFMGAGVASAFVAVFSAATLAPSFGLLLGTGAVEQSIHGVAFDKSGDLVVTGNAAGPITFPGGMTLTPQGTQDAFVAKIKGDGSATVWAKLYGNGTAGGEGVVTDATGNIYVTGDHKGSIDFGGGSIDNGFGPNVFAAKLDANGGHVWSKSFGDSMAQHAHGIGVDPMGRVLITGQYASAINFGGGSLMSAGSDDIFVARLDTKGCQVWAKSFGDVGLQTANGLAVDATGDVIITGNIGGTVNFGSGALTAMGDDVFVAKFAP